jgi:hypothetical protein
MVSPSSAKRMIVKIAVREMRTISTATSLGVLGLFEASTSRIIWLMKLSSGFTVTFAFSVSLMSFEPPISGSVAAFLTGIDSPVRSDSSTMATPSMTSESIGMMSPFSSRIQSPLRNECDGVTVTLPSPPGGTFLAWTSCSSCLKLLAVFLACLSARESESVLNQTVMRRMIATST